MTLRQTHLLALSCAVSALTITQTLAKAGLDAIITNRVRLISEALQVNAS